MEPESDAHFLGNHLISYGNKSLYWMYEVCGDYSVFPCPDAIVTYCDSVAVSTCLVLSGDGYAVDGNTLKIAIGIDTVTYNIKKLPGKIDPVNKFAPKDAKHYAYSKKFQYSKDSRACHFVLDAYLPENPPGWIRQFVAMTLADMVNDLVEESPTPSTIKDYVGGRGAHRKVGGIDAASNTPEAIARWFANDFKTRYMAWWRTMENDEDPIGGPEFDIYLSLVPAWESADHRYVTYIFYTYIYANGTHGAMEEYYLTFNAGTGEVMGFDDIFKRGTQNSVLEVFDKYFIQREQALGNHHIEGATQFGKDIETSRNHILLQQIGGAKYPRPALTKRGVVFTYQPYWAGSFSDGIIHILVPYSALRSYLHLPTR